MVSAKLPPFLDVDDWNDNLEKTEPAAHCIRKAWALVDEWLDVNAKSRLITVDMIAKWHEYLFGAVFPQFAGRVRNEGFRMEVHFGNDYNGVGHRFVDGALRDFEGVVHDAIAQLDNYPSKPRKDYELQVVRAASWSHCEFIRIHPFLNGNGRVGRLIIDYFAYRYDLQQVGIVRPSNERYISAMDYYLRHHKSHDLCDFLIPLMAQI